VSEQPQGGLKKNDRAVYNFIALMYQIYNDILMIKALWKYKSIFALVNTRPVPADSPRWEHSKGTYWACDVGRLHFYFNWFSQILSKFKTFGLLRGFFYFWPLAQIAILMGKVVLITGVSSGIGKLGSICIKGFYRLWY
jgi:hypothetical protein